MNIVKLKCIGRKISILTTQVQITNFCSCFFYQIVHCFLIGILFTTLQHSCSVQTILVITLEESSYIDITLFDIYKQEFYTKMNLIGEITFEDHRVALITGYLPHEILSRSIFDFVHTEDLLIKFHALWKCKRKTKL